MPAPYPEPRVLMRHYRTLGYCARGVRNWYAQHGFNYSEFLKNGTPASQLEQTGDAFAVRACVLARQESNDGK